MHRTVEQLGGRAGRDPFALSSLTCSGAWNPCHPRPWLPGSSGALPASDSPSCPHISHHLMALTSGTPTNPISTLGAPPRGPCMGSWRPSTAASRPCCGTQCSRRCGSSWGRSTSRSRSGRRPCGATRPRPATSVTMATTARSAPASGGCSRLSCGISTRARPITGARPCPPCSRCGTSAPREAEFLSQAQPPAEAAGAPHGAPRGAAHPPRPTPAPPRAQRGAAQPHEEEEERQPRAERERGRTAPPRGPPLPAAQGRAVEPPPRRHVGARAQERGGAGETGAEEFGRPPLPVPVSRLRLAPAPHRLPPGPRPSGESHGCQARPTGSDLKASRVPRGRPDPSTSPASVTCVPYAPRPPPRPAPPTSKTPRGEPGPSLAPDRYQTPAPAPSSPAPESVERPPPGPAPPPSSSRPCAPPPPSSASRGPPEPGPPPPLPWLKGPGVRDQGEGAAGGDPLDEILFGCGGEPQLGPCDSAGTRGGFQDSTTSSQGSRGAGHPGGG
ncbi:unnamed protein product [Lepidochelys olivacea]